MSELEQLSLLYSYRSSMVGKAPIKSQRYMKGTSDKDEEEAKGTEELTPTGKNYCRRPFLFSPRSVVSCSNWWAFNTKGC